jgi:hypothetical protein
MTVHSQDIFKFQHMVSAREEQSMLLHTKYMQMIARKWAHTQL